MLKHEFPPAGGESGEKGGSLLGLKRMRENSSGLVPEKEENDGPLGVPFYGETNDLG